MEPSISQIEQEAKAQLEAVGSLEDLELVRLAYLGRKGKLPALMERLKGLAQEDRKNFGREVNRLKSFLEEAIRSRREGFVEANFPEAEFDETLPPIVPRTGRLHPITQCIQEILRIFDRLGFTAVRGPEIETEFHNFTALNIPLDHPSRDSFDTFYTTTNHLLRSQTSTVQIRVMESRQPPLRIVAPGRVYRPDTVDASHSFMFHQIEGLMVDEKTTFSDLKGVLHLFLRELFGSDTKIRFRPHFFPFTEPSVEVDIQWGSKGWLEILGAGSVDPNVFDAVGYDSKKYQGFAFGLGVERIAMLRHGITDIRHFTENDIRFLRQFP
jgi:phenylalanyl-tRNA synthetase alpha chain